MFHVVMECKNYKTAAIDFKMPVWSPGYYQKLDYANNVENFEVIPDGGEVKWEKISPNTWRVNTGSSKSLKVIYDVKATRPFVATSFLDSTRGYIIPASMFFHVAGKIKDPVTITVRPYSVWKNIATGLSQVAGKPFTFTAPDFDVLYDSPILVGNLEELPSFNVKNISHRFIAYKPGEFDRTQLMNDLRKIVVNASEMMGDIPYSHYRFIGIGPGAGGIEHLNSATVSFNGSRLKDRGTYVKMLHFLAHEYFHHYNVKRIRPIELGPFDYDNGSRTNSLWVSEGLSVYYEYMITHRAGLSTVEELLNAFKGNIVAFETKTGKLYQTLAQASYGTWSDGPFGRTNDTVVRTISYYDKGPVVGLLLDFKIRNATNNKKSLDDVMRMLYNEYYQKKQRGFNEVELREVIEKVAGTDMTELYDYIYTTKELDYKKYLGYAGLAVDDKFNIIKKENPSNQEIKIFQSWLAGK